VRGIWSNSTRLFKCRYKDHMLQEAGLPPTPQGLVMQCWASYRKKSLFEPTAHSLDTSTLFATRQQTTQVPSVVRTGLYPHMRIPLGCTAVTVHQCLHDKAPKYLADCCVTGRQRLRSAHRR